AAGTAAPPKTATSGMRSSNLDLPEKKRFTASRPVAVDVLARNLGHNRALRQNRIHFGFQMRRNKQEDAAAAVPCLQQVGIRKIDVRCVWEGGSKPHGSGSSFDQLDRALEIKQ